MRYVIRYKLDGVGLHVFWSGKFEAVGANMSVLIKQTALLHEAYLCDTFAEAKEKLRELIDEKALLNVNSGETWIIEGITDKELFDARLKGI
jgi:hypothetical protein